MQGSPVFCILQFLSSKVVVARMAKLADAQASGACGREAVQVQVLFRALRQLTQEPSFLVEVRALYIRRVNAGILFT